MGRLVTIIGRILLWLFVLVVLVLIGFRVAAALREKQTPQAAAPAGGLFAEVGGLKLHYLVWGPPDGQPLLLIHGTAAWAETFRDIAEPLGRADLRVIAVDMPPFGYSERPPDQDYSRAAGAKRILGFADALKLTHFSIGVHSYGGGGALEAAFTAPRRIDALVLLDVALSLDRTDAPAVPSILGLDRLRETLTAATFTNPLAFGYGLRSFVETDDPITADRIATYTRPLDVAGTTEAVGHWLLSGLLNDERGSLSGDRANYHAFKPPVLVIWGRDDTVTPLAQGQEIASLFPNARLEVLDGVNHIPQVERPGDVVRLIADFLRRGGSTSP